MSQNRLHKVGKYDVLDIIGRGGMGVIYKATDPAIGRQVAIKMITASYADDPDLLKRFYREAKSTGTLQHPNIVTVYELGDQDGMPYLVMEFLEGEGLDKIIATRRPISLVEKISIALQICQGLSYAHQRHIVHRDIKPANIIVLKDGSVKIVDFGIARIGNDGVTKPGQVVGSIHYMSPEQINAHPVDSRTDIFSVGVLLYELVTYTLPFQGRDTLTTLMKILNEPPAPLDTHIQGLPPELNQYVLQALAKDRDQRYASIEDFTFDLSRLQDRLKGDMISGYLHNAEDCMQKSEWAKAREIISHIFRIDRQHTKANLLSRQISASIQREQVDVQIRECRIQAEQALAEHRYDDALAVLDQALGLRKTDPTVIRFRDAIDLAKSNSQKLQAALHRADDAHSAGDLEEASAAINAALAIDPENPEAKALQSVIKRETEELARQRELDGYIDKARKYINSRQFTSALEVLTEAELLDNTAARVHELIEVAKSGRELEHRRREIERYTTEIQDHLDHDDYQGACSKADEALGKFPDERAFIKLKNLAERQIELEQRRSYVEAQVKAARRALDQHQSDRALQLLRIAVDKYPGEPALLSQIALVSDTIERERIEQLKSQKLQAAREALRNKDFETAIHTLEVAQTEFNSNEFDTLLQFARDEATAHFRQQKVSQVVEQLQGFIAAEEYDRAVQFLERSVLELPDPELEALLINARRNAEDLHNKISETIALSERLLRVYKISEAVKLLESQPDSFARSHEFCSALEYAREMQSRLNAINAAKEQVRSELDQGNFERASDMVESYCESFGDTTDLKILREEVFARRERVSCESVERAIHDARLVLLVRSYGAALDSLREVETAVPFVTTELRNQYDALKRDAEAGATRLTREDNVRRMLSSTTENDLTIAAGSATESEAETLWASAATATPIPQDITAFGTGTPSTPMEQESRTADEKNDATFFEPRLDDQEFERFITEVGQQLTPLDLPEQIADQEQATQLSDMPEQQTEVSEQPIAENRALDEAADLDVSQPSVTDIVEEPAPSASPQLPLEEPREMPVFEEEPVFEEMPVFEEAAVLEDVAVAPEAAVVEDAAAVEPSAAIAETPEIESVPIKPAPSVAPVRFDITTRKPAPPARFVPTPTLFANRRLLTGVGVLLVAGVLAAFFMLYKSRSQPAQVQLNLTSSPAGATVRLGEHSCTTPECSIKVSPGTYQLQAYLDGYQPIQRQVTIQPQWSGITLDLKLQKLSATNVPATDAQPETASPKAPPVSKTGFEISGGPPDMSVKVDGKTFGTTNNKGNLSADLKPGRHTFEFSRPGFKSLRIREQVVANEVLHLSGNDVSLTGVAPPAVVQAPVQPSPSLPQSASTTAPSLPPAAVQPPPVDPAIAEWKKVSGTRDTKALSDFVQRFPGTPQAAEAAKRLEELNADAARAASAAALNADRTAIQQTISRYAQAYQNRDVSLIASVWPSLNQQERKKIQDSFDAARSIQLNLRPTKEPEITGDQAVVTCSRSLQYTFPRGVQKPLQDVVTIHLKKSKGLWVIDRLE